ncbi:MAG: hypothetical protein JJT94_10685 [Bernardetiaceae bacterium]|nr:hypothetical protein [Bernardetiaceae bacterium]
MIISANKIAPKEEFESLLMASTKRLNELAIQNPQQMATLAGRKIEPYISDLMSELAVGTPFENSIELISGQKFPYIIAQKFYGVEVKTTLQNHWKTTGNSVLEGTRVEGIERIFMLFAKLATPPEFRSRPYEDCLSEVVVTHSPRYLIDMELTEGNTIFDKINIPYDDLRKQSNPIEPIISYYKTQLKPGEETWWLSGEHEDKASSIIIKMWNHLPQDEKRRLKYRAMAYFPEIFGSSSDKFGAIAIWLITRESVVCPNIRDLFTAGGRASWEQDSQIFHNIPRIFINLFENIDNIVPYIYATDSEELALYWKQPVRPTHKIQTWIDAITYYAKKNKQTNPDDIKAILQFLLL